MNLQRTLTTVFAIAWAAGFGSWLGFGRSDWHLIGLGMIANCPSC